MKKTTAAIASGNQPPCTIRSVLALKKAASTARNTPVAPTASHSGYFQP